MIQFLNSLLGILVPAIAIIIIAVVVLSFGYVKFPPDTAKIISGLGKQPRVLIGKAGFKIPFFERVDELKIGQIDVDIVTEDYIPTKDFINIQVDAIAQVSVDCSADKIQLAMKNFLNKNQNDVRTTICKSLQGNLREIIGTMSLKDICQNKAQFSTEVKTNAEEDMAELGIKILSFNVQNINDKDGLIDDLGIDNREQIRKSASIARAEAEKEVNIAKAKAENEANIEEVRSQTQIAERNNELEMKKADLKVQEDTKRAEADAAYKIQAQSSRKTLEVKQQEADIAKREKEIELQAREAEVAEKKLDAEIRKKAEAEKYAEQQRADAEKYVRERDAEAKLFEEEKEAAAILAKGKAEAEAIKLKGIAEAEAIDKKAEAMKKYGDAAKLEMIIGILPEVAKAVASPIAAIDKVSIIGGDSNGVADVSGNVPVVMAKTFATVEEATGINMVDIVKADTYDAKVNRKVSIEGAVPVIEKTMGTVENKMEESTGISVPEL